MSKQNQKIPNSVDVGAIGTSDLIYHLAAADTPLKLTRPAGSEMLVLMAEVGDWRYKLGDHEDADPAFSEAAPTDTVDDGSGSMPLAEGKDRVLVAPSEITVVGEASGILTYYWL